MSAVSRVVSATWTVTYSPGAGARMTRDAGRAPSSGLARSPVRGSVVASGIGSGIAAPAPAPTCDDRHLLPDVDADRAPGDAPSAPDTPARSELVVPGRELVRQPLAVAFAGVRSEGTARDLRESVGEAGIPSPFGGRRQPVEVGVLHDAGAEAGRADQRAVRAGETSVGHRRPPGMFGLRDAGRPGPPSCPWARPSPGGPRRPPRPPPQRPRWLPRAGGVRR